MRREPADRSVAAASPVSRSAWQRSPWARERDVSHVTRAPRPHTRARRVAHLATAVALRKAAAGGRAENPNTHVAGNELLPAE
jgi:hypothetical protein